MVAAAPMVAAVVAGAVAPPGWATAVALAVGVVVALPAGSLLARPVLTGQSPTRARRRSVRWPTRARRRSVRWPIRAPQRPVRSPAAGSATPTGPAPGLPAVVRTHFDRNGGYVDCAGVTVWASADDDPGVFTPGVECVIAAVDGDAVGGACRVTRVTSGGAA